MAASKKEMDIIKGIEARQGPVGPGHHNEKRTAALLAWLQKKERTNGGLTQDQKTTARQAALSKGK